MKKQYILLKDTPELKKGAIFVEECEDGNQDYITDDLKFVKFLKVWEENDTYKLTYFREEVEKNPEWFKEIVPMYLSPEQVKKVKKFLNIK